MLVITFGEEDWHLRWTNLSKQTNKQTKKPPMEGKYLWIIILLFKISVIID